MVGQKNGRAEKWEGRKMGGQKDGRAERWEGRIIGKRRVQWGLCYLSTLTQSA
jgi:hypothetical protein